ncbi:NACHT domain-containing protein [Brunnivagina elsteri]|uniref:NACHT domain-containing protein n=1 Tax=Brunnivagina elsteri CCALA 953 TaxID=987040 RepID=A0A2A2TI61_9CYAN|nr:NACHT domain-containing protein [Calothrix elsteri]PAX53420.1 hypothetical protein CK510_14085 [Calothrix elsteri CCALA 953]
MSNQRKRGFAATKQGLILIEQKKQEKHYTIEKLEEKSGISSDRIKALSRGERLEKKSIEAIARALELQPTDIVDASEWFPQAKTVLNKPNEIDWYLVCQKRLEKQQETQRLRHQATSMGFEVNIDIPLGLVERKEQQRWIGKESSRNYEPPKEVITQIYKNEEFLQQVIGKQTSGKNKHIAIIGEPGAGKTTLLSKIADFIQSKTQNLAIYVSLASLGNLTLQDYLLKKWLPEAMGLFNPEINDTSVYEGELIKRFRKSDVWLLLDAVDEMGENSPVSALTKLEKELKEDWLIEVRVVLTCRLNVWDININRPLTGFDTYKTQEFKPEEIDKFITDWFTHAEKTGLGEILQAKLKESRHERIYQLVQNPLRLSLLCQIFYRDENGELPETKAGLYQRYVRYFYEWKPKNIPVELIESDDLKGELHQALGKLALTGIDSNYRFQLPRSLCREHMDEKLFKLACDVGWLVLAGRTEIDEEIFVFWHQNFQEYFAALAIDDWYYFLNHVPDNPDEGTYRIFEPQWKEVILLWMGREGDNLSKRQQKEYINALISFDDELENIYLYRVYYLALLSSYECKNDDKIDKIIKYFIDVFFNSKLHSEIENIVTTTLININKIIIEKLNSILENSMENKQLCKYKICNLAVLIGKIDKGNLKAVKILSQILLQADPNDIGIIQYACNSLGEIGKGSDIALKAMAYIISNSPPYISLSAWYNIGKVNKDSTVFILNQLIRDSSTEEESQCYASILAHVDPEGSWEVFWILNKMLQSQDYDTLESAFMTLNAIHYINLEAIEASNIINSVINIIETYDDDSIIGMAAIFLGKIAIDGENIISSLTKILNTSNDNITRCDAANSLYNIGFSSPIIVNTLYEILQQYGDDLCKCEAARILNRIDSINSEATTFLIELVCNTQNQHILVEAVEALKETTPFSLYSTVVNRLNKYLYKQYDCRTDACYDILLHCAQSMNYPDFYRAWHSENYSMTTLEQQFINITFQLQSTNKTYPILINVQTLEDETDTIAISQEICNQIYLTIFPDVEIPEVSNAPQLKRMIPQIKNQLRTKNLALIFNNCQPNQELITFCRKLTDVLHITLITNHEIEAPLRGFPANQPNLLSAIQSWIDEIE